MDAVADRPVTVNVAAVVALAIFAFDTVHVPKVPVLQLAVPPVLHVPDAVTPLTGPRAALSTRIAPLALRHGGCRGVVDGLYGGGRRARGGAVGTVSYGVG